MQSRGFRKEQNIEKLQWFYNRQNPSKEVVKEMMGLTCEVAINILWRNYCYTFGGEIRLQDAGGPIGQRPTMAASRLIVMDFMRKYERILLRSEVKISVLKIYVGDGRQVTSRMRKGMRYSKEEEQARAELCQAQHSLILELHTN